MEIFAHSYCGVFLRSRFDVEQGGLVHNLSSHIGHPFPRCLMAVYLSVYLSFSLSVCLSSFIHSFIHLFFPYLFRDIAEHRAQSSSVRARSSSCLGPAGHSRWVEEQPESQLQGRAKQASNSFGRAVVVEVGANVTGGRAMSVCGLRCVWEQP